jgi:arginyl-tRNA synthetase
LTSTYLKGQITEIVKKNQNYCRTKIGKKKKIQIEFISANPTGPLTVGNARGGYLGDVLTNVLKYCGYKVIKEYLINDAGNQIENLGHSVLKDEKSVYQGDYINELHTKIKKIDPYKAGQKPAKINLNQYIKKTIKDKMKIKFDRWFSEQKNLHDKAKITKIIDWLKAKNYLYLKDGAWWFKSSQFGDDKDRVMAQLLI